MRLRAHIALLTLLLMVVEFGSARTINVSSASAVNKTWGAGDTLVFSQGTFSNQSLVVQGTGTQSQPVVLQAHLQSAALISRCPDSILAVLIPVKIMLYNSLRLLRIAA